MEYSPLYAREIWDYIRGEMNLNNCSSQSFDWPKLFLCKAVYEQVVLFNKTILNVFHNFILNDLLYVMIKIPTGWLVEQKH